MVRRASEILHKRNSNNNITHNIPETMNHSKNYDRDALLSNWDNNDTNNDAELGSSSAPSKINKSRSSSGKKYSGSNRSTRTGSSRSRRSRSRHQEDIPESNNSHEKEGPNMLTMLFIAVALATVFNMSKSTGSPDPATIVYKSEPGRVRYDKSSLRSSGVGIDTDDNMVQQSQHSHMPNMQHPMMQQHQYPNPFASQHMMGVDPQQQMMAQQQYQQMMMMQQQQGGYNVFNPMQQQQQPFIPGGFNPMQQGIMMNQMPQQQVQMGLPQQQSNTLSDAYNPVAQEQESSEQLVEAISAEQQIVEETPVVGHTISQEQAVEVTPAAETPAIEIGTGDKFQLNGFKDAWDPPGEFDLPVFWHIPKAGGSTVKDIMGTCHRFTQASEAGIAEGHENDSKIAVVRPGGVPADQDPSPFINCDPTTIPGISHCKELGLAESNLADFISTSYIFELEQIFTPTARGRLFTVFRHPVDRAVSMFYYIQIADWEPTYNPDLAKMTLEEYAQSEYIENNWMTRQLSGFYDNGDVTEEHMNKAMDVIRRKFLVGLLKEKQKTMERFEKFFGWKFIINPENQEKCRETLLTSGSNSNSKNKQEKPKEGDPVWNLLAGQNLYDIELYKYIESLFVEQEQFVAHLKDGFRNEGATCAKCVPPTFPPVAGSSGGGGEVVAIDQSFFAPVPEDYKLDGFKDVSDPFEGTDQPVFWHIPKAGGSTVKDIMGTCHRFTQASEAGIAEGHDNDPVIAVVRPGGVPADQDPSPFINCDPTTIPGIDHCKELGLAESNLADYMASPYVWELEKVFSPKARGRLFTVFRHPVDRAVSMFFYIQVADWEPTYNPDLAKMTVAEYAVSPHIENNWMVRTLTQAYAGEVGEEHLKVAKDIIKRKFLVGLLKEKRETMERVEKFFRFKFRVNPENQEKCREKLLTGGSNSNAANKQEKPKKGDESYELVAAQNVFDIKLYEFIEEQFKEQASLFKDIEDGYRKKDASCAKCVPPTFPMMEEK